MKYGLIIMATTSVLFCTMCVGTIYMGRSYLDSPKQVEYQDLQHGYSNSYTAYEYCVCKEKSENICRCN